MKKYKRIKQLIDNAGNPDYCSVYAVSCSILTGWKRIGIAFVQLCKEYKTSPSNVIRCLIECLLTDPTLEKKVIDALNSKGLAGNNSIIEYNPEKPTLYID